MPSPLTLGLIGVGRWGQAYLRTIQQLAGRCILKAVCCRHPEQAVHLPPTAQVMTEWQAVVRGPCEAVIIATPPDTHAEIVTACLEAGKPCLVEKPLCLDVPTAQRLHQLAVKSGVAVLVDHTQLFSPAYETLRRHLRERGEVARVVCSEGMAFGPFRRHTSALWDWAPHDVSLCVDLVGRLPTKTVAVGGPRDPQGLPEMVSLRLEFEGGALAWIHAGRLSPDKRRRLTVVTDRHLYVVDDLRNPEESSRRTPGLDEASPAPLTVAEIDYARRYESASVESLTFQAMDPGSTDPPLTRMLAYFLKGLRGGDRQRFGTALAVDVVRVLAACETAML